MALVAWLLAIQGATWSRALLLTLVFACALALPLGAWIPQVVMGGFRARPIGAYGLWAVTSLSYVPAILVLGVGLSRVSHRSALYPWAAGLGWALVELSYRDLWPRVPWLVLGAPQIDTPVAVLASIAGVHGVSALVVAVNALLAQVIGRVSLVPLAVGASLVACIAAIVVVLVPEESAEEAEGTPLQVAIVQPAVPMPGRADLRFQYENMQALFELSRGIENADLIIWPENSLTSTLEGRADLAKQASDLADELQVPLLIGAHRRVEGGTANSVVLFEPGSKPQPVYDKQEMLPFVEAVPPLVGRLLYRSLGQLAAPLVRGPLSEPVEVNGVTIQALICYEAAFSGMVDPQAELVVNVVNDGWYDRTPAANHHFLLARWRAVESATPLIRVAMTGVSASAGRNGTLNLQLPLRSAAAETTPVALPAAATPFGRTRYTPLVLTSLVVWALALYSATRSRGAGDRVGPQ